MVFFFLLEGRFHVIPQEWDTSRDGQACAVCTCYTIQLFRSSAIPLQENRCLAVAVSAAWSCWARLWAHGYFSRVDIILMKLQESCFGNRNLEIAFYWKLRLLTSGFVIQIQKIPPCKRLLGSSYKRLQKSFITHFKIIKHIWLQEIISVLQFHFNL